MTLPRIRQPARVLTASETETVFDALVRAHYGKLCGFAARLVDSDAIAEELVQDVLAAVWQQGAAWRPEDPVSFLYRAVRNRAVMHYRRERVRLRWAAGDPSAEVATPSVAETYEVEELRRAIARAIEALPERCRMVYRLSREDEMTYEEIAAGLGLSVKTVESHMGRALKALRAAVRPHLARTVVLACAAVVSRLIG
jgi:RNA polymerase sigma-70 factor (ECF subfamily)